MTGDELRERCLACNLPCPYCYDEDPSAGIDDGGWPLCAVLYEVHEEHERCEYPFDVGDGSDCALCVLRAELHALRERAVPDGYEVIGLGDLGDTHEMNKRVPVLRPGKPEWWIIWYDGSPQSGPFETAIAAAEAATEKS